MARSIDPPWWWKPWLGPYYRIREWWERPREVKWPTGAPGEQSPQWDSERSPQHERS